METNIAKMIKEYNASLNRTMQYGNYCDCAETNTNVLV